jgi:magnesium-transporting ATPase (P-type)
MGAETLWHAQPPEAALRHLQTAPAGLSAAEAAARLATHGRNKLPEAPKRGPLIRLLLQFHNILIYVLLGAAVITALLGHLVDAGVILVVVIVNAVIGFIQEGKAERAMDAIRRMLAPRTAVRRDGERRSIDSETLVPGDIVLLEAGDKVPADLRLLQVRGLQMQEAMLTGESAPVDKGVEPVSADAPLGDRACMAFSGALITAGQGEGVVAATGAATEIGRIGKLLSQVQSLSTPLIRQMDVFAKWLTAFILGLSALLLLYGRYVAGYDFVELFMAVVGLAVAAIPEGLPAVLTITMAVGVQAMARRNVIVRRLPAIETLGSVSVICTDKTGTLTRNEMMVVDVVVAGQVFEIDGEGYEPKGAVRLNGAKTNDAEAGGAERPTLERPALERPALERLARAAALCNDATLRLHDGAWTVEGDPMEGALSAFSGKIGVDARELRGEWPRTDAVPFDAGRRFMATLHHDHDRHAFIFVKGAPEQVLKMCRDQRTADGGTEPLDAGCWRDKAESVAAAGRRVLALAERSVPPEHTVLERADMEGTLTLLGMVGLIDPPRAEAVAAVAECRAAGIRVKMITGDHAGTARAIGRQVGLQNTDAVLTGADIDGLDAEALQAAAPDIDIFARTSPEHKLRLVTALQACGLTVAMTGDGVNDAPALKRADAGVAMGMKGSEAAKEAASLVLSDDNFTSIAAAVREGRAVYDNIKKVIAWTLPTSAGAAATVAAALLFGMTQPITPVQILWVNLITAASLGMALAFEPPQDDVMRRPPRPRDEAVLSGELIWRIVFVSAVFLCGVYGMFAYALDRGHSVDLARTIAVNTLVMMEIFHLFFIRNIHASSLTWETVRATKEIWTASAIVVAAQLAITYLPPLQKIFGTEAMSFADCLMIVGVGAGQFMIIEAEKRLRLRLSGV